MALITIREAAQRIGVSRQRMYVLVKTYNLETTNWKGKLTFIDEDELKKLENRPRGRRPWKNITNS